MSKAFTPKLNQGLPAGNKIPLASFIQQLTPKGMTPAQVNTVALATQSGNGGLPVGTGKSRG